MKRGTYILILAMAFLLPSLGLAQNYSTDYTQNVLNQNATNPNCPPGYQGNDYIKNQQGQFQDPENYCLPGEDVADCYKRTLGITGL